MIYDTVDDGLHAVMFPVRKVEIFAETEPGQRDLIPGKKALVNDDTHRALSVVSEQYHVLCNRTALELARKCCITAFPNTAPANWEESVPYEGFPTARTFSFAYSYSAAWRVRERPIRCAFARLV